MNVKSNSLLLAIFAFGVASSMGGCAMTRPKPAIGGTPTPVISNATTHNIKVPVKILVAIDLIGSSDANKVPNPAISQIKDLTQVAMDKGGDVRVDSIESNSDRAMVVVSFPQPEAALPPLEPRSEDDVKDRHCSSCKHF